MKKEEYLNHPYKQRIDSIQSTIEKLEEELDVLKTKFEKEISPEYKFFFHERLGLPIWVTNVNLNKWRGYGKQVLALYKRIPTSIPIYRCVGDYEKEHYNIDLNQCRMLSDEELVEIVGYVEERPDVKANLDILEHILSNNYNDTKLKKELNKEGFTIEKNSKTELPNEMMDTLLDGGYYYDFTYEYYWYVENILEGKETLKFIKENDYVVFAMYTLGNDDEDMSSNDASYNSFFIVTPNYGKNGRISYIVTKK